MSKMEYKQTMWAEMKPDIYDGKNCDQVRPQWFAWADGDRDGDFIDKLELDCKQFPPGTKVVLSVPCCPDCGEEVEMCKSDASCGFNWDDWMENEYQ